MDSPTGQSVGRTRSSSPSFWKATEYLMGNHTIAERMFRHDPASYDNPLITAVGEHLDQLLAQLITAMDGDAPTALRRAAP
jgi:hypothetical protein